MKRRWLVLEPSTPRERTVALDRAVTQIGRGDEATVRVASHNVSALHASIVLREGAANLIDLDSTNGTVLNGKRVASADLHDGDRIELAELAMVFREEEAEAPVRPSGPKTETYVPLGSTDTWRLRTAFDALVADGKLAADEAARVMESISELHGSARRLAALYAVLERVLRTAERPEMVRTMLAEIAALLELEVVGLYLREESRFYVWEHGEFSVESRTDSVSATLLDSVLESGEPRVVENVGADSSVLGFESLMRLKIQSLLCLPVTARASGAVGVLYCVSRTSGQLRLLERDRLFLAACSSVIAVGLESLVLAARTAEDARADERSSQQRRYSPVIRRLQEERENLSLKLHGFRAAELWGLDEDTNREMCTFIERAARADVPVLLLGETGVGKSVVARRIHEDGRPGQPFVTVDCATLASELVESELFGHEKGSFTGAYARKEGKVAAAGRGTVFVDEVGDLSPRLQGKLLRLIESGEYEPVGSTRTARTAARLVFATNRDLAVEVEAKTFRSDLFYRLNVLSYTLPPLRGRRQLVLPLAEHFRRAYAALAGSQADGFTEAAAAAMVGHAWPGNVRELENAVMRALIRVRSGRIDAADLDLLQHAVTTPAQGVPPAAGAAAPDDLDIKRARERLDRDYIERALALCGRNVSHAARKLNLSRNSLMELMKKYGVR